MGSSCTICRKKEKIINSPKIVNYDNKLNDDVLLPIINTVNKKAIDNKEIIKISNNQKKKIRTKPAIINSDVVLYRKVLLVNYKQERKRIVITLLLKIIKENNNPKQ